MDSLREILGGPVAAYLLVATITATVLPAATWLALRCGRVRAAAHRHAAWLCCLVGIAVLPILWVAGPKFRLTVLDAPAVETSSPRVPTPMSAPLASPAAPVDEPSPHRGETEPVLASPGPAQTAFAAPSPPAFAWLPVGALVAGVWLVCAVGMLARLALAGARLRRLVGRATALDEREQGGLALPGAADLRVLLSREVGSPVCTGLFRPCILLPKAWFETTDPARLRLAMRHELAHIERRDCLLILFQRLVEAVLFYHPLVWLASGSLAREREQVCDNHVLASGGQTSEYAELLADIAELGLRGVPLGGPALLEGDLLNRVRALLDPARVGLTHISRRWAAVLTVVTLAGLVGCGTIRLTTETADHGDTGQTAVLLLTVEICEYPFVGTPLRFREGRWKGVADPPPTILDSRTYRYSVRGNGDHSLSAKASGGSRAVLRLRGLRIHGDRIETSEWAFASTWRPSYRTPGGGDLKWHELHGGNQSDRRLLILSSGSPTADYTVWIDGAASTDPPLSCCVRIRLSLATDSATRGPDGPERMVDGIGMEPIRIEPEAAVDPKIRQAIIDLRSADRQTRMKGAMDLGRRDAQAALPALIEALGDEDPEIRKWVSFALAKIGGDEALAALVSHWRGQKPRAMWYIHGALRQFGKRVVPPALDALGDSRPRIRAEAAGLLAAAADPVARVPLEAAFQGDPDPAVRRRAAVALACIGGPAVQTIAAAADHPDQSVRAAVAGALAIAKDPETIPALLLLLQDQDRSRQTRGHAQRGLAAMPEQSFDPLVGLLGSPDPAARRAAVYGLAGLGSARTVPHLLAALRDPDPGVRSHAVRTLRHHAATPGVADALLAALDDESAAVTRAAAKALGQVGDRRAVDPLLALLNDESASVIGAAATALGQLGDRRAVGPLLALLPDDRVSRGVVLVALAELGEGKALEPAIQALGHESSHTRREAAAALGILGDPAAVPPLAAMLQNRKELSQTRDVAARALGRIGGPSVVPPLIAACRLRYPNVNHAAEAALLHVGHAAVPKLSELTRKGDSNTRHWAMAMIDRIKR